jgi:Zn finger protein HypA/HybF involved in hydrogenase expression
MILVTGTVSRLLERAFASPESHCECRNCGTTVTQETDECPNCGSEEFSEHELE